jgi:hypothetical protein
MATNPFPRPQYPAARKQTTVPPRNAVLPLPENVARQFAQEVISSQLIDEFAHQNWWFASCPRVALNDPNGGDALTYVYNRLAGTPKAVAREYNKEVTETFVEYEKEQCTWKNLASAFAIDKDIAKLGGAPNQFMDQWAAVQAGLSDTLNEMIIRGDPSANDPSDECKKYSAFEGIESLSKQSYHQWTDALDLTFISSSAAPFSSSKWAQTNMFVSRRLAALRPGATWGLGNATVITALNQLRYNAQVASFSGGAGAEGVPQGNSFYNMTLVDMGNRAGMKDPIIPVKKETVAEITAQNFKKPMVALNETTGEIVEGNAITNDSVILTSTAYFGSFGPLAFQAIHPGSGVFQIEPPIMSGNGYVKHGDMELKYAIVMKSRNCLGTFQKIYLPFEATEYFGQIDQ